MLTNRKFKVVLCNLIFRETYIQSNGVNKMSTILTLSFFTYRIVSVDLSRS